MKKSIISIIIFYLLCLQSFSQHKDKYWYYYWSGSGNSSDIFQLHNPQNRWTDTLQIPLTPYQNGWVEFNGRNAILRGGHAPFFNLLWNTTDSFRLEFELALDDTAKLVTYVVSCYDPVNAGGWGFNWWFNYGGQFDFYNQGLKQAGVSTALAVGSGTLGDTSFHRYKITWSKSDSTMLTYKDDTLANIYTQVTFGNTFIHSSYGICIGNRIEFPNTASYSDTYTNTVNANLFKGKIREFIFAKNDTALVYNMNSGNHTQVQPARIIHGALERPVFPLEYTDRFYADSNAPGSYFFNNGAAHGVDTMDAGFVVTGLKNGYRDCYPEMSSLTDFSNAEIWSEPFGGHLVILNDTLYYCGNSNSGNGFTALRTDHDSIKGVAKWDPATSKWLQLGYGLKTITGTSGTMYIFPYGDTLISAGYDVTAVGVGAINYVAQRKAGQNNWSAMGGGFNDVGFSGASAYGYAYVGGFFTQAGSKNCLRIAKWNGSQWDSLRGGLNSVPLAIKPYMWNGERGLLVGGSFTEYNQGGIAVPCNGLAFWSEDSLKWKKYYNIETNLNGSVYDILNSNDGWLYFCGSFDSLGEIKANSIARFKMGKGMQSVGSGIFMQNSAVSITSIVEMDDIIYIAGSFSRFNGMLSNNFAAFNKITGQVYDVGYGVDMRVEALAVYQNDIIICGDNFNANGKPRWIISRYRPSLNQ